MVRISKCQEGQKSIHLSNKLEYKSSYILKSADDTTVMGLIRKNDKSTKRGGGIVFLNPEKRKKKWFSGGC